MKKLIIIGCTAVVLLFVLSGCPDDDIDTEPDAPRVEAKAIEKGAKLRLTWTAVENADDYIIWVDGVAKDTITETSYDVEGPAKLIEVAGHSDGTVGKKWSLDLTPVPDDATVYGRTDPKPEHPSGLILSEDGATPVPLRDKDKRTDYVFDDYRRPMSIVNAGDAAYNITNGFGNVAIDAKTTDFDAAEFAPEPGAWESPLPIAEGGVYYLWLDRNNNGWDDKDHYAKMKVISIIGHRVDIRVAYQKFPGIRWVKTK